MKKATNKLCRFFGHKWKQVYIGKNNEWQFITCYCQRCHYGFEDIGKLLNRIKHDFGTYHKKYYDENN